VHHVEESVRRFVERELVELLRGSPSWGCKEVEAGAVEVGSNRVRFEVCCAHLGGEPLQVAFEEQAGWLVAGVSRPGWLPRLGPEQARALQTALAGLYKLAGVHLVREQVAACLGPAAGLFHVKEEGLVVWPAGPVEAMGVYDLGAGDVLTPRASAGPPPGGLPELAADRVLYQRVPVLWERWVAVWEQDQAGKGLPGDTVAGVQLLPPGSATGSG
jgi:hypothetical protein